MKPLTMLEFVQESNEIESIKHYANFLSQKPEKWMFVPCDENGNVLEDPCKKNKYCVDFCQGRCQEDYNEALDRVIFEGFTSHNKHWVESENISFILINNNRLAEYKNIYDLINEAGEYLTIKKPIQ